MKYAVIGGGIAGISCAQMLADNLYGSDDEIYVFAHDSVITTVYQMNKISTTLVDIQLETQDSSVLKKMYPCINFIFGTVSHVNSPRKMIYLADQQCFGPFDRVCICTGAIPKMLENINTECSDYIIYLRDNNSVKLLKQRVDESKHITVLGNGGVALQVIETFVSSVEITWVFKSSTVGESFYDRETAEFLLNLLKNSMTGKKSYGNVDRAITNLSDVYGPSLGPHMLKTICQNNRSSSLLLSFHKETFIHSISKLTHSNQRNLMIRLENGTEFETDLVVCGLGVIPNSTLADNHIHKSSYDGGIYVNEQMRTNVDGVFAAGDVASTNWDPCDTWFQMRLWTQARTMGIKAAKSMLSIECEDLSFEIFTHMTEFMGQKVALLGRFNGYGIQNHQSLLRSANKSFVKVILDESDRMKGAILIGDLDLAETFENLILSQMPLTRQKEFLLDPNVDIGDYFD